MTGAQSGENSAQQKARRWRAWPIRWAMKDAPVATSAERAVLNAYAYHCDSDGTSAYPGPTTLAEMTMLDETTIKRARRGLVARKIIARGDQSKARRLPSGQRPTVFDLMIPASWYAAQKGGKQALREINEWRADEGLEPIGPANRPDLAPAPEKKQRADKGVPRKPKAGAVQDEDDPGPVEEEGGSYSPPFEPEDDDPFQEGGLEDPPRGGYETPQGVAESPPTSSFNQGLNRANDICGDGRSPTTGSRSDGGGGSAALADMIAPSEKPKPAVLRTVIEGIPEPLKRLLEKDWPRGLPGDVNKLIEAGLTTEHRTAAQLLERMARRWQVFGYEDDLLSQSGKGIHTGLGVLQELLSPSKCWGNNIDCEDGIELHTGRDCPRCEEERQDRIGVQERDADKASVQPAAPRPPARAVQRPVPEPRPEADATITPEGRASAAAAARQAVLQNKGKVRP